ncbi:MAG: flavodoxin family protein [Pseudomonadales bacterium]
MKASAEPKRLRTGATFETVPYLRRVIVATVGVVYFSGTGTTREIADSVCTGVQNTDSTCLVHEIVGGDIGEGRWHNDAIAESLDACDAIVFGSPTYMGGVSAQLKAFFDAMVPRWYSEAWHGKLAAAFTVSAKVSGDKLNCLQDINTFAMQMGMIWIGTGSGFAEEQGPNGFYLGVGATAHSPAAITEVDTKSAVQLGQRVATLAAKFG